MGDLAAKLREARARRGWSLDEAVKHMPGVSKNVLYTLEGRNAQRESSPGEMKLRTAVQVASAYFGDITLRDLMGPDHRCLLEFKPRENRARRALKQMGYQPPGNQEAGSHG